MTQTHPIDQTRLRGIPGSAGLNQSRAVLPMKLRCSVHLGHSLPLSICKAVNLISFSWGWRGPTPTTSQWTTVRHIVTWAAIVMLFLVGSRAVLYPLIYRVRRASSLIGEQEASE